MAKIESARGLMAVVVSTLLATCLAGAGVAVAGPPSSDTPSAAAPIDLNRATVEQLESVPGIGAVMAQRIVDFREQHGPFRRVDDLLKVKGIGEKSLEKLRPYFVVNDKD